jgi:hypothetical protein
MKLALLAAGLLAACSAIDDVETSTSAQELVRDGCPVYGCGTNSPTVGDGLVFDELDPTGATPNRGGLYFSGAIAADGTPVKLRVVRHALEAYALDGTGRVFRNYGLINTVVTLKHPIKGLYQFRIEGLSKQGVRFWARWAWDSDELVPFYQLKARRGLTNKFDEHVCVNDVLSTDPLWTGLEHSATFFQWDHYDVDTHEVTERSPGDPVFNIACAATAPAKMHLLRHTRAGSMRSDGSIAYDTTVEQRQAILRMLTADYCGDGRSFTVHGHPLVYVDANDWYHPTTTYSSLEAIWGPDGAVCLDDPRMLGRDEVIEACGRAIPKCYGDLTAWTSRGHVYSANP